MAPNFEAVVSVYLQICDQICRDMAPYPCIFVEDVVPLLREMTDKLVLTLVRGWTGGGAGVRGWRVRNWGWRVRKRGWRGREAGVEGAGSGDRGGGEPGNIWREIDFL